MPAMLRRGAAAALALACGIPRAGAADAGASDERVLASNRPSAQLLGLDAHDLYWAEAAGRKGAESAEILQRVSRQGGAPETLAEFPTGVIWPAGFAATERAVYVADGDPGDPASARIVAVSATAPHKLTPVVASARGLDGFVVAGDRLFWVQSDKVTGLWAARLDGTGRKLLWKAPAHAHVVALAPRGPNILVSLLVFAPRAPDGEGLGLGSLGAARRDNSSKLVLVPMNSGAAKDLWSASGDLSDAATAGDDVLVCSVNGLVRVHGAQGDRLSDSCAGDVRAWQSWRLEFDDAEGQQGHSLYATSIAAPRGARTLVSKCASGFSVHAVLPADDGLYFCRRADADHCSIVHVPAPPATDDRCSDAGPAESGHGPPKVPTKARP
jgi:hypothetical protein